MPIDAAAKQFVDLTTSGQWLCAGQSDDRGSAFVNHLEGEGQQLVKCHCFGQGLDLCGREHDARGRKVSERQGRLAFLLRSGRSVGGESHWVSWSARSLSWRTTKLVRLDYRRPGR